MNNYERDFCDPQTPILHDRLILPRSFSRRSFLTHAVISAGAVAGWFKTEADIRAFKEVSKPIEEELTERFPPTSTPEELQTTKKILERLNQKMSAFESQEQKEEAAEIFSSSEFREASRKLAQEKARREQMLITRRKLFEAIGQSEYLSGWHLLGTSLLPFIGFYGGLRMLYVAIEAYFHKKWKTEKIEESVELLRSGQNNHPPLIVNVNKESLARSILYLPPIGGKIPVASGERNLRPLTEPSLTAEEQTDKVVQLIRRGEISQVYIHQLTVQGRLPDEFKYAALSLILSSPYFNDWGKSFYETSWGQIAPLVHDGGNTSESLNPLWKGVKGRTDFLMRISLALEPRLEELKQLSPQERQRFPLEKMSRAWVEEKERERLLLETKAYQRLALALHAKCGTAPKKIPEEIRHQLATRWDLFKNEMGALLQEYEISGAAEVTWFNTKPRFLWPDRLLYGQSPMRFEADWPPIKEGLMRIEEVRRKHPEIGDQVRDLLAEVTGMIDQDIGLLTNPPPR